MTTPTPRLNPFTVVIRPLQEFFRLEAASGILVFAAAAVALVWANSRLADVYTSILAFKLGMAAGSAHADFTVHALINEGLMTIFFFVVGMEIKRELAIGELRTRAKAMLPAVAALGGMIVPSGIYVAFNWGGPGMAGWAIPMATDIAFCVGLLTLLKKRVSAPLVIFLTALAIFDDIGGILVIALFYGKGLHLSWLGVAAACTAVLWLLHWRDQRNPWLYAVVGAVMWYALHHGGIHVTIAGVIVGMFIPARTRRPAREVLLDLKEHSARVAQNAGDEDLDSAEILAIEEHLEDLQAPLSRLVHALHPVVAFVVMPVFALANSGVSLAGLSLPDLLGPVCLGSALGLFVGKQLGIFGFAMAMVKTGLSPMPGGARPSKLYGVGIAGGIGFTVALFIAGLAFAGAPALLDQAKLGILIGSALSGVVASAVLYATGPTRAAG